jgi:RimJ/RimL family protein N-acetyltransferase
MTAEGRRPGLDPGSSPEFTQAPRIETDRLFLRGLRAADLDPLSAIWSNPDVVRFLGGKPLSREDTWRRTLAACGQWPVAGFGYWIVELKSDGRVVGQVGFADFKRDMRPTIEGEPELGYVFDPSVHGQGIAFEGCKAAIDWADAALGNPAIPAIIDAENAPSVRLAERLGFERLPDAFYRDEVVALFRRPGMPVA